MQAETKEQEELAALEAKQSELKKQFDEVTNRILEIRRRRYKELIDSAAYAAKNPDEKWECWQQNGIPKQHYTDLTEIAPPGKDNLWVNPTIRFPTLDLEGRTIGAWYVRDLLKMGLEEGRLTPEMYASYIEAIIHSNMETMVFDW